MNVDADPPSRHRPDFTRFTELRERHAGLVAPVAVDIPGLGRCARVICKPIRNGEIEVAYEGVSERGQAIDEKFTARASNEGAPARTVIGTTPDGRSWSLSGLPPGQPHFHDPESEDCAVGLSEDLRIQESIRDAARNYMESNPNAILAFEAVGHARRSAVTAASVLNAESDLALLRKVAAAVAADADRRERELDEILSPSPAPGL